MVIEIEKSKQKRMQRAVVAAREEWQEKKENITK